MKKVTDINEFLVLIAVNTMEELVMITLRRKPEELVMKNLLF